MCAAGPPKAIVPSLRKSSATSRRLFEAEATVAFWRSHESQTTDWRPLPTAIASPILPQDAVYTLSSNAPDFLLQERTKQMLSKEENELITRTGPGTPMGELFRRY